MLTASNWPAALTRADLQGYQPQNQVRFRLARAEARAGEVEEALSRLERLAAAGFANTAVLQMPDLESLRGQARFQAFERRVQTNAHPCGGTCSRRDRREGRSGPGRPV